MRFLINLLSNLTSVYELLIKCPETPSSSCVKMDFMIKCGWTLLNVDFNAEKRQYN